MNTLTLAELRRRSREAQPAIDTAIGESLPALRVLAVSGVREHFQRQESPDGKAWKALAHPRPDGGSQVLRDKGLLMASVRAEATPKAITLFASHPAAALHQYGGTVTAKRGKYLAIPLTKEAKRVGSPRINKFPRRLFVVAPHSSTSAFLCESTRNGLVFHYVLKTSVFVPARPYLGFSPRTLAKIDRVIADRLALVAQRLIDPNSRALTRA